MPKGMHPSGQLTLGPSITVGMSDMIDENEITLYVKTLELYEVVRSWLRSRKLLVMYIRCCRLSFLVFLDLNGLPASLYSQLNYSCILPIYG